MHHSDANPTKSPTVKVMVILAMLGLLYLTWVAASWGLADAYARPVMVTLNDWKQGRLTLTETDWIPIQQKLKRAVAWNPGNPEYLQWYALALEAPYRQASNTTPEAVQARIQSLDYLRKVTTLRPTWPLSWLELALMKHRMSQIDEEFFQALHTAIEHGPWEPGLLRAVTGLTILTWNNMPFDERVFMVEAIRRGIQHPSRAHTRDIQQLLLQSGLHRQICATLIMDPPLKQFCDKAATTSDR